MIQQSIDLKVSDKIVRHRNRFHGLFLGRYLELLPNLITYKGLVASPFISIDPLQLELGLRSNHEVVLGLDIENRLRILGYINNNPNSNWIEEFQRPRSLRGYKDINFIIPIEERQVHYKEISYTDNCKTGNFSTLKNKTLNYVSDLEILQHYTDEVAEIVVSRFSLSMQAKILTFFIGEEGDVGIDNLVSALYNGSPFIKVTSLFDKEEQIVNYDGANLATNFTELKREYQNKISELNNMLGINSLAVEKASGVSDTEAKSNRAYTESNANIYLTARNDGLKKLNKRYGISLEAIYNDRVESELAELYEVKEDESDRSL